MKKSVLLLLFGVVAFAVPCSAIPILDQESPYETNTAYEFVVTDDSWHWQQGVTVDRAGPLVRIDLYVRATGSAELSLYVGEPWQSGAPVFTLPISCGPGWNEFPEVYDAGLEFDVDDKFVIAVRGINDTLRLGGSYSHPAGAYARGELWGNGGMDAAFDLAFRTWVVPEPATIAFLGLGGLALLRSRRSGGSARRTRTS